VKIRLVLDLNQLTHLDVGGFFAGKGIGASVGPIVAGIFKGILYALIFGGIGFIAWIFFLRPLMYNIIVEKQTMEGNRPFESNARGRIFRGKDGVVKFEIYQGMLKKAKKLPEPPSNYYSTFLMPNGKTKKKIRALVSSEDVWTWLPSIEINVAGDSPFAKINVPESDVDLWNIQEKKSIQRALIQESWWEKNRSFIQYIAAWIFTFLIIYIVVNKLGDTLTQAQSAIQICQNVQTQCQVAGAALT